MNNLYCFFRNFEKQLIAYNFCVVWAAFTVVIANYYLISTIVTNNECVLRVVYVFVFFCGVLQTAVSVDIT